MTDETLFHSTLAAYDGMELSAAAFGRKTFPRHFHNSYMIKVMEEGAVEGSMRSQPYASSVGCVLFSNPCEAHSGQSIAHVRYRAFFIPPTVMRRAYGRSETANIAFHRTVVHDDELWRSLLAMHRSMQGGSRPDAIIERTLRRIAETCCRPAAAPKTDHRVCAALEILHHDLTHFPSLGSLSGQLALSRNQLTRIFRRDIGLTPKEYHMNVRLEKAREALNAGGSPAQIAAAFGFSDQSHFGRHFKRYFGVAPGSYLRSLV